MPHTTEHDRHSRQRRLAYKHSPTNTRGNADIYSPTNTRRNANTRALAATNTRGNADMHSLEMMIFFLREENDDDDHEGRGNAISAIIVSP